MTRAEALAEARRRWGITAEVRHRRSRGEFHVGFYRVRPATMQHSICGVGRSWEDAFADADRRTK